VPAERPGTRTPDAPDAAFLDTFEEVKELAAHLEEEELIGLDTEADSFHSYFTKVCLVQVSSRDRDWIVDPLAVESLAPLERVLADPGTTCVLHGADYDLRILDRDHGLQVRGLFDTMVAARLLGYASFGLSSLLERHFGLKVPKQHQRADWSRRPLTPAMLRYAATDTHFLPELHDILRRELESAGRLAWAQEEFALLEEVRHQPREENPDAYLKLKGARALPPRKRAVLREVHQLRDRIAREQDRAAFRVLGNTTLVEIARRQPRRARDLAGIKGMPRSRRRGFEADLLEAVQRGLDLPESDLPRPTRRPDRPRQPEPDLKPLRALRDRLAAELELDPGLVAPNALLEAVARSRPETADALRDVPGMRRWQVETFGTELLAAVAGMPPPA
jgi:ribonuclease D